MATTTIQRFKLPKGKHSYCIFCPTVQTELLTYERNVYERYVNACAVLYYISLILSKDLSVLSYRGIRSMNYVLLKHVCI